MSCQCNTVSAPSAPLPGKRSGGRALNFLAGSMLLLMPKCAMCWAAYMGFFGWAGFSALAYRPWFLPVAALFFCLTMVRMLWRAVQAGNYLAFGLSVLAALAIAWQKWTGEQNGITTLAVLLMALAWLLDFKTTASKKRFSPLSAE